MNAEIEREKQKVIQEWVQRANDDLESAKILLRESKFFDISAYHSHQAIEKMLKAQMLKQGKAFRFIHDLNALFQEAKEITKAPEGMFEKVSFVNSLYPKLRYPTGDVVTAAQAEKCLKIAESVLSWLK